MKLNVLKFFIKDMIKRSVINLFCVLTLIIMIVIIVFLLLIVPFCVNFYFIPNFDWAFGHAMFGVFVGAILSLIILAIHNGIRGICNFIKKELKEWEEEHEVN